MQGIVEVDETYLGNIPGRVARGGVQHKMKILSLVTRGGEARSVNVKRVSVTSVTPIIQANVAREAHIMTDERGVHRSLHKYYAQHSVVNHAAGQYVRGMAHTNTIEGYCNIFKRGMRSIYQWCSEKHLHRYLAEFNFRYSSRVALGCNDADRADRLLKGIVGRRLTYQHASARA